MATKNDPKHVLAIDVGASGGRAIIGTFDGETIEFSEIHRFSNDPVVVNGTIYWDVLRLLHEIKQSIRLAAAVAGIDSVGVDTWGVDFGLLDKKGDLMGNPVHYRDARTVGMIERSFEKIGREEFYKITGVQFMELNTVFQLLALKERCPDFPGGIDRLLFMPDLFHYFLCGAKVAEISAASTAQLLDARNKTWSDVVLDRLGLPRKILPELVKSGTVIGSLREEICGELGVAPTKVIAVAGHDTQSAMAATPAKADDFLFLSCGTWSLLGTELDVPLISDRTLELNLTNEIGFGDKISFLKNIVGLWLLQESRRQWAKEGNEYSFADLERMAEEASPLSCFVDTDDPVFTLPGNMPERIREYCLKTGQRAPHSAGEVARCVNESLAMKHRATADKISECTGKRYETLHMLGGGTKAENLCQMTADACGISVSAGPVEATILGNIAAQFIALGEIESLSRAREIIADSSEIVVYKPQLTDEWERAYQKFREVAS